MKRMSLAILALSALALSPQPGWAQRERGRGPMDFGPNRLGLLSQKSVQDELKLSEDQVQKVTELLDKQRESFRGMRGLSPEERRTKFEEAAKANDAAIAEVLSKEQVGRLKQISLQQQGMSALADPDVAASLKLTDEQKEKVKSINEETSKERREILESGDRDQTRAKMQELRKKSEEKLEGVLTDDQKKQWKEMLGSPFQGELRRGGPGRRPGGDAAPGRPRRPNRPGGANPAADGDSKTSTSLDRGTANLEWRLAGLQPPRLPSDQTSFARFDDRDEDDDRGPGERRKPDDRRPDERRKGDRPDPGKRGPGDAKDHRDKDKDRPKHADRRDGPPHAGPRPPHGPPHADRGPGDRGRGRRDADRPHERRPRDPRFAEWRGRRMPPPPPNRFDRWRGGGEWATRRPSPEMFAFRADGRGPGPGGFSPWRGPDGPSRFRPPGPPSWGDGSRPFAEFRRPPSGPPAERGPSPPEGGRRADRTSDFERRLDELQRQIEQLRRELHSRS